MQTIQNPAQIHIMDYKLQCVKKLFRSSDAQELPRTVLLQPNLRYSSNRQTERYVNRLKTNLLH